MKYYLNTSTERYKTARALLGAVNPSAILNRGYAIARTLPERKVVMDAGTLKTGQPLEIQLAHGKVDVRVIESKNHSNQVEE